MYFIFCFLNRMKIGVIVETVKRGFRITQVGKSKFPWHSVRVWQSVQSLRHVRLCNPSTPGFPVHHQLPEVAQTHVHWIGDAIQSSYPLSSPFPPVLSLSQHQGLFKWVTSLHQVAKMLGVSASASVLPMNIQDWFPLGLTGLTSLQSKGLSRTFSNITVQKHQFFGAQLSLYSNTHTHTWLLEKP